MSRIDQHGINTFRPNAERVDDVGLLWTAFQACSQGSGITDHNNFCLWSDLFCSFFCLLLLWSMMVSGLPLNRFIPLFAIVRYVKYDIFPVKFCFFFCLLDRASSASTKQTMKIIEFSLFSVLVFKGLRNNKPDKLFGKPLSFFFGRKSWQKEPHARYRCCFSGTPAA